MTPRIAASPAPASIRAGARRIAASALWVALSALAAGEPAHAATIVNRCEAPDGHVTYSDEACPPGTRHARAVEESPAVEVHNGAADKSGRNAHSTGTLQRAAPRGGSSPDQQRESASEQRRADVARCDDLVRRIEYTQQDLAAASASERASVELALRRLQAEHKESCGKR
jgi:hypothetical protein